MERSPPGRRFQNKYEAAHRKGREISLVGRMIRFGLAIIAFALGVVFAFIPGPAFVFFALAGGLLATESRCVAKGLDWTELKLRAMFRWLKQYWKDLGLLGRIAVVTLIAVVAMAFFALMVWFYFLR
ncbi:MAG: hypothetical protein JWM32_1457 [Verrucomicrobia bacterium]|nr:hypothetical protein [Verrucomicrobiota bacterium]